MAKNNLFFNLDNPHQGLQRELGPGLTTRIFSGDQAMLSIVEVAPNAAGTRHSHPQEQWGVLLKGSGFRRHGDKEIPVKKGDFWRTPGGLDHGFRAGPEGATILDIFSPPREEYKKAGSGFGSGATMEISEKVTNTEHETVLCARDSASGYRGIIAIHSSALGPAMGGTRLWNYSSEEEALTDALRLSRGMTYKNALPGLPLGGGKAVIIGDGKTLNREAIFRAHGRFVDALGGRFITAEDVGTSPIDMEIVRRETRHVRGLLSGAGDPSPFTARGVFRAMQAAARCVWNGGDLSRITVAIQGCGNVGYHLAKSLNVAGAKLIVSDVDAQKISRVVEEFNAIAVRPEEIFGVRADIFAPCALGGVINDQTIPKLAARVVAGAANNQLLEDRHGEMLHEKGILYVPDYAANAGGVFSGCIDLLGWDCERAWNKVDEIYDTILGIFDIANAEGISTNKAADRIAEKRLRKAAALRTKVAN